ncbi:MAG: flagellar basal body P-ring formation protein FlgA [Rhodocyclales bacterium]|nr:flagellar basal body P-ring formation protein FlgA [Rhodocyclales bacterium]
MNDLMHHLRRHAFPGPLFAALAVIALVAPAAAGEEAIRQAVTSYLEQQAATLPGPARHEIGTISAGSIAAGCRRITVTTPGGARPWGRTHVQAKCSDGANWSLFVPVDIHVSADYLVSARPLRAGQTLTEADIATRRGDLAELPSTILTDPRQALGQITSTALPAERPLRSDLLRKPVVIRQGQNARVISAGSSFQVSSEGKAMGNAAAGQVVQMRMASGQIVSGVAQADGSVRVGQ